MASRGGEVMTNVATSLAAILLILSSQAHLAHSWRTHPDCMVEWFVHVGIPENDARVYVSRPLFYETEDISVSGLRHVYDNDLLSNVGIDQVSHQNTLLWCANNQASCPESPCFNGGTCNYSESQSRFTCSCNNGWEGDRCRQRSTGRVTKGEMRHLLKQFEKREVMLENRLNDTIRRAAEESAIQNATIERQAHELQLSRGRMVIREAKNIRRKHKLRVARERASNATRDRNICRNQLSLKTQEAGLTTRLLSECRVQLGAMFRIHGCGVRPDGLDGLGTGDEMGPERHLISPDGRLRLTMRRNGTVQAAAIGGDVFWSSRDQVHRCRQRNPPYRLMILETGELQARDGSGCVLWSSGTGRGDQVRSVCLLLENSRHVSLYAPCGQLLWRSGADPNSTDNKRPAI